MKRKTVVLAFLGLCFLGGLGYGEWQKITAPPPPPPLGVEIDPPVHELHVGRDIPMHD